MYLFNSEKPHQGWVNKICMYVCIEVLFHTFTVILAGPKKIVRLYTEDFVKQRFVKSRFHYSLVSTIHKNSLGDLLTLGKVSKYSNHASFQCPLTTAGHVTNCRIPSHLH